MIIGQKICIAPDKEQIEVFRKACGIARYTYNWALCEWKRQKSLGVTKVTRNDLKKLWNATKPEWVYEAPKDANQQPFTDLYNGLNRYFKKQSKFPKMKKKGRCKDSFYISNDKASIDDLYIKLPFVSKVRMDERLKHKVRDIKIMSCTVSAHADKWYVSVNYEIDDSLIQKESLINIVGIDVGLNDFAVDSNGNSTKSPKPLKKYKDKLAKLQRCLSKKKRGSKNRQKTRKKVAKCHARIANIRKDFLHKLSTDYVKNNKLIAIEDLDVKQMLKNHKLALHIADASWGEFKRMLEYKSKKYNSILIKIDKYFASTKTCCECETVKDKIGLGDREYICHVCGSCMSRDYNASINILAYALRILIPRASGVMPMELVSLAKRAIASLNNNDEVPFGDNDSFIESLGNQVLVYANNMNR